MTLSAHIARPVFAVALLVLSLGVVAGSSAVEVRVTGAPPYFESDLVRAYEACLAPNDVSRDGIPACSPPRTSVCAFRSAHVTMSTFRDGVFAFFTVERTRAEGLCEDGTYLVRVAARPTFTAGTVPGCGGAAECTARDLVAEVPVQLQGPVPQLTVALDVFPYANYEILGITIIGPDGLPMASAGSGQADGSTRSSGNVSVGYPPCTNPAPGSSACPAAPVNSSCDFGSGTLLWQSMASTGEVEVSVRLHDLSGSSPLCTTGTYEVASRMRLTMNACGALGTDACTLVDSTVTVPAPADHGSIEAASGISAGGVDGTVISAELLGSEIHDPTGALIGATAATGIAKLTKPRIRIDNGRLRVHALFPYDNSDPIDPTFEDASMATADGMTLTLRDRNGVIYSVTLPATLWQLQPPVGSRWDFIDRGGIRNGVRNARIRRVLAKQFPVAYAVQLAADGVDLSGADLPSMTLTIGISRSNPNPDFAPFREAQGHDLCRVTSGGSDCRWSPDFR